jgi:ribonuclease Z
LVNLKPIIGTLFAYFELMHQPFEIVVLGTASATPTRDRNPSSHYVRFGNNHILIDCGEGTQNQLLKYGLKMHKIRTILITHLHGDHYFGLPGLLFSMALNNRQEPLTLVGPSDLKKFIEDILAHGNGRFTYEINFISTENRENGLILDGGDFHVHTVNLQHRIPCTGFVIEEVKVGRNHRGNYRKYAYISDTIYDESIVPFIENADLLYHEATFLHDRLDRAEQTFHTTALQTGRIASLAGVKKLMIGHFSSRYTDLEPLRHEAATQFELVELAVEGKVLELIPQLTEVGQN